MEYMYIVSIHDYMDSPLHLIVVIHGHTFRTPQIEHVFRILDGIFKSFHTCPSLISTQAISHSLCTLKNKNVFQSKQGIFKITFSYKSMLG